jgi:hypothetical protein
MTDEEGLELIYLPPDYIEEDFVKELPEKKQIYYFRQGITLEESQGFGRENIIKTDTSEESLPDQGSMSGVPLQGSNLNPGSGTVPLQGSNLIPGSGTVSIPVGSLES